MSMVLGPGFSVLPALHYEVPFLPLDIPDDEDWQATFSVAALLGHDVDCDPWTPAPSGGERGPKHNFEQYRDLTPLPPSRPPPPPAPAPDERRAAAKRARDERRKADQAAMDDHIAAHRRRWGHQRAVADAAAATYQQAHAKALRDLCAADPAFAAEVRALGRYRIDP